MGLGFRVMCMAQDCLGLELDWGFARFLIRFLYRSVGLLWTVAL